MNYITFFFIVVLFIISFITLSLSNNNNYDNNNKEKKRVLISGGASGALARHLSSYYCHLNWEVTIVDTMTSGDALHPHNWITELQCPSTNMILFYALNMKDFINQKSSQIDVKWTHYYHLIDYDNTIKSDYYDIRSFRGVEKNAIINNELMTFKWLMNEKRSSHPEKIVFFSRSAKYDTIDQQESCRMNKEHIRQELISYGYKTSVVVYCLPILFGDDMYEDMHPYQTMMKQVLGKKNPISLSVDSVTQPYTFVDDVLSFMMSTLDEVSYGSMRIIKYPTRLTHSLYDIAKTASELQKYNPNIIIENVKMVYQNVLNRENSEMKLITSIPVLLTHLAEANDHTASFELDVYTGNDAVVQSIQFCAKYAIDDNNCGVLVAQVKENEADFYDDLNDLKAFQQGQYGKNHLATKSHFHPTLQACDSRYKVCQFRNLYYDTMEERFFMNRCAKDDLIKHKMRFIMQGTSIASFIAARDTYNFTTRCLNDAKGVVSNIYEGKTVLISRRSSPWNAGHIVIETAIPVEKLFNLYNASDLDSRVILFDDDCFDSLYYGSWTMFDTPEYNDLCAKFTQQFVSPLSSFPLQFTNKLRDYSKSSSLRYLRIDRAVVGIGTFSPYHKTWRLHDWMGPTMQMYKEKIFRAYNVPVYDGSDSNNSAKLVTFIYKIGRRSVLNYAEVMEFLQSWCDEKNFRFVAMDRAATTLEFQLLTMSETNILVSVGGAAAYASLFLQRRTSFVYFPLLGVNSKGVPFDAYSIEAASVFRHLTFTKLYEYKKYDEELLKNESRWGDIRISDGSFIVSLNVLRDMLLNVIQGGNY